MTKNERIGVLCQDAAVTLAKFGLQGAPLATLAREAAAAERTEIRNAQEPILRTLLKMARCSRLEGCSKNGRHDIECERGIVFSIIAKLRSSTKD